jgi:predicted RNase H-like nuclease (RuvC/YqgF family)
MVTPTEDAWDREWDAQAHTVTEYRTEIRELRERIIWYVSRIEALEAEVRELRANDARWVMEP